MVSGIKADFSASIVVFFVSLPLCLGIALASGAPLFSGVIAGIIGGIVVGYLSGSRLGVSGPAAGLAVIVLEGIDKLGGFEIFLVSIIIAGLIQIAMGFARLGFITYFFPSSVITGMLSGIGILIVLKQIPFALGYHATHISDEKFHAINGENTISILVQSFEMFTLGTVFISLVSIVLFLVWENMAKRYKFFEIISAPIGVVFTGIGMVMLYKNGLFGFTLAPNQMVTLPLIHSWDDIVAHIYFPNFTEALSNLMVYKIALVMAIIGSLETLLSVEAADKLDPYRRVTPTNRELKAQGVGNVLSGLIGGLPVTQVIVRSSANITFGAKSKLSAILHGFWLLISVVTIGSLLNLIPLSSLSVILIFVGYKLAKPKLFIEMYESGLEQFVPFIATIIIMLFTDLLTGVMSGVLIGIAFALHHSYRNSYFMKDITSDEQGQNIHHIVLSQEVSFFNKASIIKKLEEIPNDVKVIIDFSNSKSVSYDVAEYIKEYIVHAPLKNITVETINFNPKQA